MAIPANNSTDNLVDIIVCTTGKNHLINNITLPTNFYQHYSTSVEPLFLGFECQKVLGKKLEQKYDYYCYLEDDLIIQDSYFFRKLNWFNNMTNFVKLLQPNRYELGLNKYTKKCYVDGDLALRVTKPFQNVEVNKELKGILMNQPIVFQRALNPHSGCYFLTHEQLKYWTKSSDFAKPKTDFIGALESAATLGIMKTFEIYKTIPEYANFLEIQHYGNAFANLVGSKIKFINNKE